MAANIIVLASASNIEELQKCINEYFYSNSYKIENNKVLRGYTETDGADVHTTWKECGGYIIRLKKGRYQFCMEM